MNRPTALDKSELDMGKVAQELLDTNKLTTKTLPDMKEWLQEIDNDLYIFNKHETGFADWSSGDYCRNMTENGFEPYAVKTASYVVMHDYI